MMDLLKKFRGAILGVALGDALGKPFEGSPPTSVESVEREAELREVLEYTDDTEMTINVARSLIERNGPDPEHMLKTLAANFNPKRGYGPNTTHILQRVREGTLPEAEVMNGQGSFGNGAAMRVAPIALVMGSEEMIEAVEECSKITHTHPLGVEGAVLQALAINFSLWSESEKFQSQELLELLKQNARSDVFREKLQKVETLLQTCPPPQTIISELGNGVEVFNSLPTSLYFFLQAPFDFKRCVLGSISLGGDADTLGSMSGALFGALNGVDALPQRWINKLENLTELNKISDQLFLLFAKRLLGEECEYCLSTTDLEVMREDENKGFTPDNLLLICRACKKELGRGPRVARPKKRGKYRAVYRRSYRRGL